MPTTLPTLRPRARTSLPGNTASGTLQTRPPSSGVPGADPPAAAQPSQAATSLQQDPTTRHPQPGTGVYEPAATDSGESSGEVSGESSGVEGEDDLMLARIEKLEAGMDRLSDTVNRIDANVSRLSGLLEAKLPELATRADVARLEGEQAALRAELDARITTLATRDDLARLENTQTALRVEFDARLPTLATKLELAEKPSKSWLMTAAATFVGMVTLGVAIGALIGPVFGKLLNL